MKNIFFLLLSLISIKVFSQSMDYPGKSIEMLEGKELKVKPGTESTQKNGYQGFYTDEALTKVYKKKSPFTKYEALVGKVFKVLSYKPNYNDYALKLENPETGIIYFKYNKEGDWNYPFEVIGGLTFPEGFFCDKIIVDKEWDSVNVKYYYVSHTPCKEDICLYQSSGRYTLYVLITAPSDRKETGLKGLTLTLENGKEVSFPDATVAVESSMDSYNYRTEVEINYEQLQLLTESPMVKKLVGNKEKQIQNGRLIMEHIKCLAKR
ncbi:hypothetical protein ACLI09_05515 [Flavobacterium sp. RHBU_24]|uniref:hypothetical protein n=1 Tax=Flavobacterium sp. RHBU_24 TaxID=3391185 RepID=UPI003984D94C